MVGEAARKSEQASRKLTRLDLVVVGRRQDSDETVSSCDLVMHSGTRESFGELGNVGVIDVSDDGIARADIQPTTNLPDLYPRGEHAVIDLDRINLHRRHVNSSCRD